MSRTGTAVKTAVVRAGADHLSGNSEGKYGRADGVCGRRPMLPRQRPGRGVYGRPVNQKNAAPSWAARAPWRVFGARDVR
jgi:hypothetical protein